MSKRLRRAIVALAISIAMLMSAGVAVAASAFVNADGLLTACIGSRGELRAVVETTVCKKGEERTQWQTGAVSAGTSQPMTFHVPTPGDLRQLHGRLGLSKQ